MDFRVLETLMNAKPSDLHEIIYCNEEWKSRVAVKRFYTGSKEKRNSCVLRCYEHYLDGKVTHLK